MHHKKYTKILFFISIILVATSCQARREPVVYPTRMLPATYTPIPTLTSAALSMVPSIQETKSNIPAEQTIIPEVDDSENSSGSLEQSGVDTIIVPTVSLTPIATDTPIAPTPSSTPPTEFITPDTEKYGRSVVYISGHGENVELRFIHEDGGQPYTMATVRRYSRLLDITLDGRFVVISNEYDGTFLIDLENHGEQIPLTETPALAAHFSPAGDKLLLIERLKIVLPDDEKNHTLPIHRRFERATRGLQLVDLTSGIQEKIILPLEGYEDRILPEIEGACWSSGGDWFVFQVRGWDADGNLIEGLYRYSLATRETDLLFKDYYTSSRIQTIDALEVNRFPVLSPDDSTIITNLGGENGLYTIPASGGITKSILRSIVPVIESPQWSPDSNWIAVLYDQDIYLLRPDGSDFHNVTQTPYYIERHLSWSPDGKEILYAAESRWGGLDIWRYDIGNQTSYRVTIDDPKYNPKDNYFPLWGASFMDIVDAASPVPSVDNPLYNIVTAPPTSPPEHFNLKPPQSIMDPPWWGERYLYRRKITINSGEPIQISTTVAERPILAQVTFDTDLILDQLRYGTDGHDIQLMWWGGGEIEWRSLPCSIEGLEEEVTVITFPLQETIMESDDDYYLYYGSLANVMRWESHTELDSYSLGVVDSVGSLDEWLGKLKRVKWRGIHPLVPGETHWGEDENLSWETSDGRPVFKVIQDQSMDVSPSFEIMEGTIALSFKANTLQHSGSLLNLLQGKVTVYEDPFIEVQTEKLYSPILFYDGSRLHFYIADNDIAFGLPDVDNHWYHFVATWQANDYIRIYIDGDMVVETQYDLPWTFVNSDLPFLQPSPWQGNMVIGSSPNTLGLPGQYANLFTMKVALDMDDVDSLYRASQLADISIAEQPELAVVVTEIPPEGGAVMAPNGQTWLGFAPNTFTESTAVSIIGTNKDSTADSYLSSLIVLPGDVYAEIEAGGDQEEKISDMIMGAADQIFDQPFMVYHRYESGYVAFEGLINLYRYDETLGWSPTDVFVNEEERIAIAVGIDSWGAVVWMQSAGLLGAVPVVNH